MHVTTGIFLLRVIDKRMHIALQRLIAARRVGVEPTARLHGEVSCLLHRLDGEITGRLDDNSPLATDPGDDGRPVFVIMAPTGLALLPATTCWDRPQTRGPRLGCPSPPPARPPPTPASRAPRASRATGCHGSPGSSRHSCCNAAGARGRRWGDRWH